jgi:nucleoside-diphosphate-sugar epimerase
VNILLTGYSGLLGRSVARTLTAQDHSVRGLLHRTAVDRRDVEPGVTPVWGRIDRAADRATLVDGIDAVVHCAWDFQRAEPEVYEATNVDVAVELLMAAAAAGAHTFVLISSIAVFGLDAPADATVDEDTPYVTRASALDVYPWAKVRVEGETRTAAERLGIRLVIVRPGLLFSDDDPPVKKSLHAGPANLGLYAGAKDHALAYIHVDDVADLIVRALAKPDAGDVFLAVPTHPVPSDELLARWAARRGVKVRAVGLPRPAFNALSLAPYQLKKLLKKKAERPNIAYQYATGVRDVKYSSARAQDRLGWSDPVTRGVA